MRIVTFESERGTSVGALVPDGVVDLAELLPAGTPQAMLEALIDGFDDVRGAIDSLPARPVSRRPAPRERARPGQGALRHAQPAGARGARRTAVRLPQVRRGRRRQRGGAPAAGGESSLWFAPALAVVVRGPVRDIAPADWRDAVFGFTGFVDVVRPGSEFPGGDDWWKSWDTPFAVGPAIVTVDEVPGGPWADGLGTVTATDPGRPPVAGIVSFLSGVMTLRTGDLIA